MTSRHGRSAFAVLVSSAAVFFVCAQSASGQTCTATVSATLSIDTTGKCSQKGVGATPNFVDVHKDNCVAWKAENNQPFDLELPSGSLLFHFSSPTGAAVPSPPITGSVTKTVKYDSVTINGHKCNKAGSLGLVMR